MNLPTQLPFTSETADLYLRQLQVRARKDFATFRSLKRPTMLWSWWTEEVARELMRFYRALTEGRRPKLALMAPPQHGKSWTIWDFIAWIAGRHPAFKTIFASYSEELGIVANAELQRTIRSSFFSEIFPGTRIDVPGWQCNNNLIEFVDHGGSFRNTTVTGQVTGFGLDLGVIDDPVKGRDEANSKLIRDRTWNWFTDDFFNRFAANAGLLIIMTRWHVDDLLRRLLAKFGDEVRVLRYPAIAEADEFNDRGKLLRRKGEALFPQHKPLDFLLERKKLETQASWESLFQQNPIIAGGGRLPIDKLRTVPVWDRNKISHSVRYWDKAASDKEDAAYTAGVLMHKMRDGTFAIENIERGRWNALDREWRIKAVSHADHRICKNYVVWVEQEPGSGGKESAEHTIRNLAGLRAYADRVTGNKEVRAAPFEAQVQAGNVYLVAGQWVPDFHDECEAWPHGKYKDQVDAAAGAFNKLAPDTSYNTNYAEWV
jgi:predicted phage terminase large subunit-like protein